MVSCMERIELDDIVIFKEGCFQAENRDRYLSEFETLRTEGKITGRFEENLWVCDSGVVKNRIDFTLNEVAYQSHGAPLLRLSAADAIDRMKCYAVYISGSFIFLTMGDKVRDLKSFLTAFGEEDFSVTKEGRCTIASFLGFLSLPEDQILEILGQIRVRDPKTDRHPRELASMVTYLAIASEVRDVYGGELEDDEFIRLFPIYFWTNVTFILPLRVTETLLTPFHCISQRPEGTFLSVRRTLLKNPMRKVYHEVGKDYGVFSYRIPENEVLRNIRQYQDLTAGYERKYLFLNSEAPEEILPLERFNGLLGLFMTERLIGNPKYDFARHMAGLEEFQVVTAGDSRPIAMSNLYYQDVGADICRQLAAHINSTTSFGYYMNVSNTVWASAVMRMQKKINKEGEELEKILKGWEPLSSLVTEQGCASLLRPHATGNISDCLKYGGLQECLGCRYYCVSKEELQAQCAERKALLDEANRKLLECMLKDPDGKKVDLDKVFLYAQTAAHRFKKVCELDSEEKGRTWQRHRNTARIFCSQQ